MKINIVHIVQSYDISGRSKIVDQLSKALADKDIPSVIVSLTKSCNYISNGANVKVIVLNKKEGFDWSLVKQLAQIIRKNDVTVIHTHGKGALFYGMIAKIATPVKMLVHTAHRSSGESIARNILIKQFIKCTVNNVVAVSNEVRSEYIKDCNYPGSKISTIYNGVDLNEFSSECYFKRDQRPINHDFTFGSIANLSEDKDHRTLLEAFAQFLKKYKDARLIIVGDGPKKEEIVKIVKELGIVSKVDILGFRKDIPLILSELDVLILSTKTEGFGISIIEAMASRIPVIATSIPAIREIIKDGINGKIFRLQDVKDLKKNMILLYEDKQLCERFSEEGYKTVRDKFSIESMVQGYVSLYSKMMVGKK